MPGNLRSGVERNEKIKALFNRTPPYRNKGILDAETFELRENNGFIRIYGNGIRLLPANLPSTRGEKKNTTVRFLHGNTVECWVN